MGKHLELVQVLGLLALGIFLKMYLTQSVASLLDFGRGPALNRFVFGVRFKSAIYVHIVLTRHPHVPASRLLEKGMVQPLVEPAVPKVPMDYTWAKRLGLVRKPANFISSISDDRGDELRSVVCVSGQRRPCTAVQYPNPVTPRQQMYIKSLNALVGH